MGGRSYRGEWLVLGLVLLSTLTIINPLNVQDVTRLSLTRALAEHGTLTIDREHRLTTDRAFRAGHWYSDKAPGLSLLAIPTVEGLRAVDALKGHKSTLPFWKQVGHIWTSRFLTAGIGLLAATFLLGRMAEGLRRGYGAPVAITYALGTIAGPLGPTTFEHDLAAALAFGGFALAAGRGGRWHLVAAGALAGAAVLTEYETALIGLVLLCFVAARNGWRRLVEFGAGVAPFALGLGAYDQAAFGSPLHLSYKYVANEYTERQHQGFFGIGAPTAHDAWYVFLDGKGLLLVSPVLVAAAAGLVLLWRRGVRAEAAVCGAASLLFLFADMGYFDPYGGLSPGPRFFAPALPFLCLGLVEAYHRWPLATGLLGLWSISWATFDNVAWALNVSIKLTQFVPNTIFARMPLIGTGLGYHLIFVFVALTALYGTWALWRAQRLEGRVEDHEVLTARLRGA